MKKEDYFKIGFVMKPHGLKGEVTASLNRDGMPEFGECKTFFVEKNDVLLPYFVERISPKNDKVIIKFEDITTPEQASLLRNLSLFLPKSSRPKPGPGEFYDDEVIGFEVVDNHVGPIGRVITIEHSPGNRFLIVNRNQKEIMIPVQTPLLQKIVRSKKKIEVMLPDGFLDL